MIGLLWLDAGLGITEAIRAGVFNVVAIATSTGYGSAQARLIGRLSPCGFPLHNSCCSF